MKVKMFLMVVCLCLTSCVFIDEPDPQPYLMCGEIVNSCNCVEIPNGEPVAIVE